ncbi:hypothetical protein CC80DRAFT_496859 [Byssothecium circinans]|uniref:STE24 endopeptidase n=1 Tax=Byssothecium circinans TaxID=147558 RepID=A0A6A5TCB6_9PLEO|nr:hypothetical protein CC80DRAFT_496859 [Byssothecium circinans]
MPTPLDRATSSRTPFFAFAAIITGVAAWTIWGNDIFPSQDPTGDPESWTHEQCLTWLNKRNLHPSPLATRDVLLERVRDNMRVSVSRP